MPHCCNSYRFFIKPELVHAPANQGMNMLDIVLLALGLGLFVISVGYAYACDRL